MPPPCWVSTNAITTTIGRTARCAKPLLPYDHSPTALQPKIHNIRRRDQVGGLIREYQQVA
jgi:hypothetical protein